MRVHVRTIYHSEEKSNRSVRSALSLFTLLFTLLASSPLSAQKGNSGTSSDPPVAVVNGEEIPYSVYDRARITRLVNMGFRPTDTTALDQLGDDGIFLSLVDAILTLQVGEKHGVAVSRKAAIDHLVANPPDYVREIFTEAYDPKTFRNLIEHPEQIAKYANVKDVPKERIISQWKTDIESLIRYYRVEETRSRLIDALYKKKPLSEKQIFNRYMAERTILEGSVVRALHSNVPDTLIPISDREARAWFASHQSDYAIPESRRGLNILVQVIPSPSDSAAQRKKIDEVVNAIRSASPVARGDVVTRELKNLPPNRVPQDRPISPAEFAGEIRQKLAAAQTGEVIGPFDIEGESLLLYVDRRVPSKDTLVRARHILLQARPDEFDQPDATPEMIDEGLRNLAKELLDSIDSEEEFMEAATYFSRDLRSAEQGGDLGYVMRGGLVPAMDSAIFVAPVGQVSGIVKTQYGYHLIWVVDRMASDLQLRELRFSLSPSEAVWNEARTKATAFAQELRTTDDLDLTLAKIRGSFPNAVVDSGTFLKRLEPYADGLAVGEFLFRVKKGEVGVIEVPFNRLSISKLIAVWEGGSPRFEDIPDWPTAHARRVKQLDTLSRWLAGFNREITPETLLGPIREKAPMTDIKLLQEEPIGPMEDEDPWLLDSVVVATESGEVSGPVRGIHALYFLRLTNKFAPTQEQIDHELPTFRTRLLSEYREGLLEKELMKARAESTVRDLRPSTEHLISDVGP